MVVYIKLLGCQTVFQDLYSSHPVSGQLVIHTCTCTVGVHVYNVHVGELAMHVRKVYSTCMCMHVHVFVNDLKLYTLV